MFFFVGLKMRKKSQNIFFHIIFPLFVGGMIYILFRNENLLMFRWFEFWGLNDLILNIRRLVNGIQLFEWVLYSLPNGLWIYSLISFMIILWNKKINLDNILWFIIIISLGIFWEICQGIEIISGTFDWIDLIFCFVLSVISLFQIKIINLKKI